MKIVLDAETTGLNIEEDEILQLSIVDENGNILFDEYFLPEYKYEWNESLKIHGITPEMVCDKPYFYEKKEIVQDIINQADEIIGYNIPFDLSILRYAGIVIPNVKVTNVMIDFAEYYAKEYQFKRIDNKKLCFCAEYYGYEFLAHNSLNDALATLYVYQKLNENTEDLSRFYKNGMYCFG